jgi:hypothetical protein
VVRKHVKVSVNENKMPLEDKNAIHNGIVKSRMVGSDILVNHPFKGFNPINLLLPHLIPLNLILGPKLSKDIGLPEIKSPFLNLV